MQILCESYIYHIYQEDLVIIAYIDGMSYIGLKIFMYFIMYKIIYEYISYTTSYIQAYIKHAYRSYINHLYTINYMSIYYVYISMYYTCIYEQYNII